MFELICPLMLSPLLTSTKRNGLTVSTTSLCPWNLSVKLWIEGSTLPIWRRQNEASHATKALQAVPDTWPFSLQSTASNFLTALVFHSLVTTSGPWAKFRSSVHFVSEFPNNYSKRWFLALDRALLFTSLSDSSIDSKALDCLSNRPFF